MLFHPLEKEKFKGTLSRLFQKPRLVDLGDLVIKQKIKVRTLVRQCLRLVHMSESTDLYDF